MIGVLLTCLIAAVAYLLMVALTGSTILGLIGAVLALLVGTGQVR